MKKACLFTFIFLCIAMPAFSEPQLIWKQVWDSGHNDYTPHVILDKKGNIYVASSFNNPFEAGHQADMRLMKYDNQGNVVWNRTYDGGEGSDYSNGVLQDTKGDIYLYGQSFNKKDSLWDLRIIKYSEKGEVIWNISDKANKNTVAIGIDIAENDNLYILGLQTLFDKKIMRLKSYDSAGKGLWEKDYDIVFEPKAMRLYKDAIYITGSRFNPQKNGWDMLLLKLDRSGKMLWEKVVYNKGLDNKPVSIIFDESGNIYIGGTSGNTEGPDRYYKVVLLKYTDSGKLLWEGSYDSKLGDVAWDARLGEDGFIYVTGNTGGSLFVVKFDMNGKVLWHVNYEGGDKDVGTGVAADENGNVIVCGVTITKSTKSPDILTVKYRQ